MERNETIFNRDNKMTSKTLSRRDNMLVENETTTTTTPSRRDGMWDKWNNHLYCLNQDLQDSGISKIKIATIYNK
jgi:hypothetical protein